MSVQVENLEKNMAKLTIEVPAEELEKAIQASYLKQKSQISVPGFRKGKVPRQMIEKIYGVEVFFDDAANALVAQEYPKARKESGLELVSQPEFDLVQLEKGKPFIFSAEVAVKPEVTLGRYSGVQVTKADTYVTEDEIAAEVEKERESNARMVTVEDRAIQDGDTAVIDYEGFADGVAFEGGKGENHPLVIGSHSFIDTFEEQLVGKFTGDEVEVHVTFPEEYHAEELAGKPAEFHVKINEIKMKELSELDDEFAQDVSEFDTLEEYKKSLEDQIRERKEAEAKREMENEAIEKIIGEAQIDVPDPMVESQARSMLNNLANRWAQQGLGFEQYLQLTGATVEQLLDQMRPDALKQIQSSLVLEAVAKAEQIEVSDEEMESELTQMAEAYNMEREKLDELLDEEELESIRLDLKIRKAADFVMEHVEAV